LKVLGSRRQEKTVADSHGAGPWLKSSEQQGEIAPPRSFDSAPQALVSRDKSVKRFAQDDGFVAGLKNRETSGQLGVQNTRKD
jgi:hypothetical protein